MHRKAETESFDDRHPWGYWLPSLAARVSFFLIDRLPGAELSKQLAYLLRKPVKMSAQMNYDREIWGLKVRLMARGNLTEQRWLTMPHLHDRVERLWLKDYLKPGDIFFDIGANAGFYTMWVHSQLGTALKTVAVEPNMELLKRMRFNLATNNLLSAVEIVQGAVTETSGAVLLESVTGNLGQSRVNREPGAIGEAVDGHTLLEIAQRVGVDKISALKIDIEGGERQALEPFFATAPASLWPGAIIAEDVGKDDGNIGDLLAAHGYRCQAACRMNNIYVRK